MKLLTAAIVFTLWISPGHAQLTVVPPSPVSSPTFTVHIHGYLPVSPSPAFVPSRFAIVGNAIRIEGCIPSIGFSTPSDYLLDVSIGPIAAGSYAVEYYESYFCNSNPIIAATPPRLRYTGQVVVFAASGVPVPIGSVDLQRVEVFVLAPNSTPHPDAREASQLGQPSQPRAGGRER